MSTAVRSWAWQPATRAAASAQVADGTQVLVVGEQDKLNNYAQATAGALLAEADAADAQAQATWQRAEAMRRVAEAERMEAKFGADGSSTAVRKHHAMLKEQQIRVVETEARLFEVEAQRLRSQAAVAGARSRTPPPAIRASGRDNSFGN